MNLANLSVAKKLIAAFSILGLVILVTVLAVTLNLLVDLAYAALDPKIRY